MAGVREHHCPAERVAADSADPGRLRWSPAEPPAAAAEPSGPLLRRAAGGDQSAWDRLVRRHSPMLWRAVRVHGLSPADATDVIRIAWLRLAQQLARLGAVEEVGSWLAAACRQEALAVQRRRQQEDQVGEDAGGAAPVTSVTEQQRMLLAAVDRLPARESRLLRMLLASPAPSYRQVAAALGIPVGTVGPTRQRALDRLRREVIGGAGGRARHRCGRPSGGEDRIAG